MMMMMVVVSWSLFLYCFQLFSFPLVMVVVSRNDIFPRLIQVCFRDDLC